MATLTVNAICTDDSTFVSLILLCFPIVHKYGVLLVKLIGIVEPMSEAECLQHAVLQVAEMIEGCRKCRYFKLTHKYQYLLLSLTQVTVVNNALKNYAIYRN